MKKVSFLGVLVGGVTDMVATNILTLPILIFAATKLDLARRVSADQIAAALHANLPLHIAGVVIGLGCSLLAGYLSALVAKHDELLNGALSSWLCLGLAIFGLRGLSSHYLVEELLLLPTGPAFGVLGGYLRLKQKRARAASATVPAG